nr:MAG TPA: hypothetical protein [Caudoviricetes sp.]
MSLFQGGKLQRRCNFEKDIEGLLQKSQDKIRF